MTSEKEEEEEEERTAATTTTTAPSVVLSSSKKSSSSKAGELFVNLITNGKKENPNDDEKTIVMETFIASISRENQHSRTDVVSAARDCREFPMETVLIDARSPSEFRKGHIPNAVNVALFEDEERKVVGTLFAKRGRKAAMARGMEFVREKWEQLIVNAQTEVDLKRKMNKERKKIRVYVHCWRGGMRSLSLGWLFGERLGKEDVEFVRVVNGGYKAFRTWILSRCGDPLKVDERLLNGGKGLGNGGELGGGGGGGGDDFGLDEDDLVDVSNIADNNKNHPKNILKNNANSGSSPVKHPNDDPSAPQVLTDVPAPRVCIIGGRTGVGEDSMSFSVGKITKRTNHRFRRFGESLGICVRLGRKNRATNLGTLRERSRVRLGRVRS